MLSMMMVVSFSASVFAGVLTGDWQYAEKKGDVTNLKVGSYQTVDKTLGAEDSYSLIVYLGKDEAFTVTTNFVDKDGKVVDTYGVKTEYKSAGGTWTIDTKEGVPAGYYEYRWTVAKKDDKTAGTVKFDLLTKDGKSLHTSQDKILNGTAVKADRVEVKTGNAVVCNAFPKNDIRNVKLVKLVDKLDANGKPVSENGKPVKEEVEVTNPVVGDNVYAKAVLENGTEVALDSADLTYSWKFVGDDDEVAHTADYFVKKDDLGKTLKVTVAAKNHKFEKNATVYTGKIAFVKTAIKVVDVTVSGDVLTANVYTDDKKTQEVTDADQLTYKWYVKGHESVVLSKGQTLTSVDVRDKDNTICLEVTGVDKHEGTLVWEEAKAGDLVVKDAAGNAVTTPKPGQRLTATLEGADGKAVAGARYEWTYVGDKNPLSNTNEYIVGEKDLGKKIQVTVTYNGFVVKNLTKTWESNTVSDKADEKAAVEAVSFKIWTKAYKNGIKFNYRTVGDVELDGYQIFRTTKKDGFGKSPIFTKAYPSNNFFNKTVKKGTMYYYKVRGYKEIDGETVYTQWSKVGSRKAK